MSKFAVMVYMGEDWMYITSLTPNADKPAVAVFDTAEDAEVCANRWRLSSKEQYVKVVEYFDVESPDPAERSWYYDKFGVKRRKQ